MNPTLAASYRACHGLTRRTASNFFYSFLTLPRAKRQAMYALYAFLRHTDDLGDSAQPLEERRAALSAWRQAVESALDGQPALSDLLPALCDIVQRYSIPREHLIAVIDGVAMDLDNRTYETFAELADYCEHVASAVGLACIHIWGFKHTPQSIGAARACGIAFQLTNILRDLREDAQAGRLYLPREDLSRFEYSFADLQQGLRNERFRQLMQFEVARAEQYYRDAHLLAEYLSSDGRRAYGAMLAVYEALLVEIRGRDGDVFGERISLSRWRKWSILVRWLLPQRLGQWFGLALGSSAL